MKEEMVKAGAPATIEEKVKIAHMTVLKEESRKTEEADWIEEKSRLAL